MKKLILILAIFVLILSSCRYDSYTPNQPSNDDEVFIPDVQIITKPAKGDIYEIGDEIIIEYLPFSYSTTMNIYGEKKGSVIYTIAKGVPNNGKYVWKTNDNVPRSNHYQIKIESAEKPEIFALGDQFGIIEKN